MSSRAHLDQILALAEHETNIMIHLAEKITDPAMLEYRPTPDQRSLLDVMGAISVMGALGTSFVLHAERNPEYVERGKQVTAETFADAMRWQMEEVRRLLADVTDRDLEEEQSRHPVSKGRTLGFALMQTLVGFLTAYKMQMFLYLKSSGIAEIGTVNAWLGVDRRPAPPQPAAK